LLNPPSPKKNAGYATGQGLTLSFAVIIKLRSIGER
jgi:hypothetical protein